MSKTMIATFSGGTPLVMGSCVTAAPRSVLRTGDDGCSPMSLRNVVRGVGRTTKDECMVINLPYRVRKFEGCRTLSGRCGRGVTKCFAVCYSSKHDFCLARCVFGREKVGQGTLACFTCQSGKYLNGVITEKRNVRRRREFRGCCRPLQDFFIPGQYAVYVSRCKRLTSIYFKSVRVTPCVASGVNIGSVVMHGPGVLR